MLFVIFFPICCTVNAEKVIETNTGYKIYKPDLFESMKDVTPFCLGSISDHALLFEYGLFLAEQTHKHNANACVIGYAEILDKDYMFVEGRYEEVIAPFFTSSAYKSAQVVENISNGLLAGGIFPFLNAKYGINDIYIENIKLRGVFPGIIIEDQLYDEFRIASLELPVVDEYSGKNYHSELFTKLSWYWSENLKDKDDLRKEILLNTIVQIKKMTAIELYELIYKPVKDEIIDKTLVFVNDPRLVDLSKFKTGYLIHSEDDFVLERIRLICKEIYTARGRKNW